MKSFYFYVVDEFGFGVLIPISKIEVVSVKSSKIAPVFSGIRTLSLNNPLHKIVIVSPLV